jgi:hypothetical protein
MAEAVVQDSIVENPRSRVEGEDIRRSEMTEEENEKTSVQCTQRDETRERITKRKKNDVETELEAYG